MASGDRIQLARISDIPTKVSELEQDITQNTSLVGISINSPEGVKGGTAWTITVNTASYLSGVAIDQLEIVWWDGTETIAVTGTSMFIERVTPAYPADPVTVSVRAVDRLGNKSALESAQTTILSSSPPIGPITINHQTSVVETATSDMTFTGATSVDIDDSTLTYEIVDDGGLIFSKNTGILSGEIVSVIAPEVTNNTDIIFSVRATDGIAYTIAYTSTITVIAAQVIGVKMVATGGNGGTWAHIDESGSEITTPTTGWFDSHPVFGGIVDQVIDGQYMVKVPKFYYKRGITTDGKQAWWISDRNIDGFTVFPAFVLGGAEVDQFWYGKYQASYLDGKLQSIPGVSPQVNRSLTQFISYATARNVGGVSGFRLHHYDMWLAIQWLYLVENGSMDSQATTGQGRITQYNAANVDADDVAQATYRGMVGLWGNVYQWLDGARTYYAVIERRPYNGTYIDTGEIVPSSTNTFPLTFRSSQPDQFIPDTYLTNNSGSTLPDHVRWRDGNGPFYPLVGGYYYGQANAGLWHVLCEENDSHSEVNVGARLARII